MWDVRSGGIGDRTDLYAASSSASLPVLFAFCVSSLPPVRNVTAAPSGRAPKREGSEKGERREREKGAREGRERRKRECLGRGLLCRDGRP